MMFSDLVTPRYYASEQHPGIDYISKHFHIVNDIHDKIYVKDRYQEGYDAGFEKGCSVGAELVRGAKDLQDKFDSLYGESKPDDLSHIMMAMVDCLIMIGGNDYGWETQEDVIKHFKRLQK